MNANLSGSKILNLGHMLEVLKTTAVAVIQ